MHYATTFSPISRPDLLNKILLSQSEVFRHSQNGFNLRPKSPNMRTAIYDRCEYPNALFQPHFAKSFRIVCPN